MFISQPVVRRVLALVRLLGRLPPVVGRVFSRVLDAWTRPFHVINHLGSCGGALVVRGLRPTRWFDRTVDVLHDRIEHESADAEHYDHHRRQLTLHGHS